MLAKTFKDLKVGDEVFLVESDRRRCNPRYVTVEKVGRKYVYLKLGPYTTQRIEEWDNNGYSIAHSSDYPHCNIYTTQEEYQALQSWKKVLWETNNLTNFNKVTRDQRDKIVELLKDQLDL